jgi:hypothetical protein
MFATLGALTKILLKKEKKEKLKEKKAEKSPIAAVKPALKKQAMDPLMSKREKRNVEAKELEHKMKPVAELEELSDSEISSSSQSSSTEPETVADVKSSSGRSDPKRVKFTKPNVVTTAETKKEKPKKEKSKKRNL